MTTKTASSKALVDTKKLCEALQKVNLIKYTRDIPALSYALIECDGEKVILTASDLERIIKVELGSVNTETFSALLPKKLAERFTHGGNGKTTLTQGASPKHLEMARDGIGDIKLTTLPVSDFPPLPQQPENLEWYPLNGKWLCSMLRIVATACAEEGERPILTGVTCDDGAIAASDGFRLTVLKDNRLAFGLKNKQVVIPLATVNLIVKLFRKEDILEVAFETTREVTLGAPSEAPKRVYIKSKNTLLTSELIQGKFPQYQQLIPNTFKCKASFSAPLLLQRLNMIDPTAIDSGIVRYAFETLETKEQVCSISATIEDEDKYHLSCPVRFEGDEAKIAFNYKYMMEALKPFSMCNFEITSPSSPGKLTGDIEGLTAVIMPMFVQW